MVWQACSQAVPAHGRHAHVGSVLCCPFLAHITPYLVPLPLPPTLPPPRRRTEARRRRDAQTVGANLRVQGRCTWGRGQEQASPCCMARHPPRSPCLSSMRVDLPYGLHLSRRTGAATRPAASSRASGLRRTPLRASARSVSKTIQHRPLAPSAAPLGYRRALTACASQRLVALLA